MVLGVDWASNRNEYQEHFLGGKGGRFLRLTTLPPSCAVVMKSGNLNFLEPSGPLQACNGTALPFYLYGKWGDCRIGLVIPVTPFSAILMLQSYKKKHVNKVLLSQKTYYYLYLNINQLHALNFIMSLFHASTCFEHMCSSSGGQNCTIQPLVSSHWNKWVV